ncbi:Gustatory receptor for sugar taste 43a [Frankliniella fusca]|uniref:Gustatory receptor for sugar taste 43a n=1 Tax=Frankliniella fusca TaxID=407009 RepID=A0AAE1I5L8_9NEOP|nr:Gustatory receptor for sugar taste 43a [Frankliniella fusca]
MAWGPTGGGGLDVIYEGLHLGLGGAQPRGGPVPIPTVDLRTKNQADASAGSPPRSAMLSRLRLLHQRVFQQVEDLTSYFGVSLLFKLVQTRIQLITDAFAFVSTLQNNEGARDFELVYYAIEVCFIALRLFVVVYRSEKVLQQDQVLIQLVCLVDPTAWDSAASQQVSLHRKQDRRPVVLRPAGTHSCVFNSLLQLFRRQVRALRARLHTCSMFTLNYDLLLAVAATTTTYLVVLVQFNPKP